VILAQHTQPASQQLLSCQSPSSLWRAWGAAPAGWLPQGVLPGTAPPAPPVQGEAAGKPGAVWCVAAPASRVLAPHAHPTPTPPTPPHFTSPSCLCCSPHARDRGPLPLLPPPPPKPNHHHHHPPPTLSTHAGTMRSWYRMPSRWSNSCWKMTAGQSSSTSSTGAPVSSCALTLMAKLRCGQQQQQHPGTRSVSPGGAHSRGVAAAGVDV
jgi:hypothetical protein